MKPLHRSPFFGVSKRLVFTLSSHHACFGGFGSRYLYRDFFLGVPFGETPHGSVEDAGIYVCVCDLVGRGSNETGTKVGQLSKWNERWNDESWALVEIIWSDQSKGGWKKHIPYSPNSGLTVMNPVLESVTNQSNRLKRIHGRVRILQYHRLVLQRLSWRKQAQWKLIAMLQDK